MAQRQTTPLFAAYRTYEETSDAITKLVEIGVPSSCISMVMSQRAQELIPKVRSVAAEGALGGGSAGALVGGLLALATLAVPGGIIAAGPLAAALGGGAAGAASGGFIGALVGFGIDEPQAKRYAKSVLENGYVIAVHPTSEEMSKNVELFFGTSRGVPLEDVDETLSAKVTAPLRDALER
jgi:hypothetical protein